LPRSASARHHQRANQWRSYSHVRSQSDVPVSMRGGVLWEGDIICQLMWNGGNERDPAALLLPRGASFYLIHTRGWVVGGGARLGKWSEARRINSSRTAATDCGECDLAMVGCAVGLEGTA